ncbi:hypothetical protein ANCDUO_27599 [Ancylostoma duodenale]|uniref:Uncharacterized protein n=1 Tax=Ancylostoma duodenale TaxID=51022 RepID=A0A0C2FBK6_9BILA|nr:hypothetical protein ANCDUO_27599 [Ancylostoma duodenale]
MNTPRLPGKLQERQKRPRLEVQESPSAPNEFDTAAELLISDDTLPINLRTVIGYLMEKAKQLDFVLDKNRELTVENQQISNEVIGLRAENQSLKIALGQQVSSSPTSANLSQSQKSMNPNSVTSFDDVERNRSVVIAGVEESRAVQASLRVNYDFNCVSQIFDFLSIDCAPVSVYRMGRPRQGVARLLKVVLPASYFARLALRRASYLRHFKVKGIFMRPSLSKAERDRIRAERAARPNMSKPITSSTSNDVPPVSSQFQFNKSVNPDIHKGPSVVRGSRINSSSSLNM